MSKVLLLDVLQSPEDFGYTKDISQRAVAYEHASRTLLLPSSQTGWYGDQLIAPQKEHTWHPFLYQDKVIITTGETTDFELGLDGKIGYDNGIACLREINKLYLSEMTEVADLTRHMYDQMPETLKTMCYWYWLHEQYQYKDRCRFGLQLVYSGGVDWNYLYYYYGGLLGSFSSSYAVRPTLYLKSGIRIDTDQWLYTREPATLFLPESENQREKDEEVTMKMIYGEIKKLQEQMAKMESKLDKRLNFIGAILRKFNKN